VLVRGETGAGKELVARVVHDYGARKAGPFVSINCGALPDSLIQGALFGHERGAFTGADRQTPGVFEQAHRGTLFLDEIGELSAVAQASLLRVLETGALTRLGGVQPITVDVRVVAATHRDLEAMSKTGAFRADLWYRLGALVLEIPPLRERPEDLRPLVDRFLAAAARATGRERLAIDDDAAACLAAYPWPGNVRELRNEIERAAVLATGDLIRTADLSTRVARSTGHAPLAPSTALDDDDGDADDGDDAPDELASAAGGDLKTRVERFEAEVIRQALSAANNHQPTAARTLGIPLRTLVYKLRKHGLQRAR
jgi:DNA-binding NtrC family response regulator